jgi:SAM-dependent MidA family methyltransferase
MEPWVEAWTRSANTFYSGQWPADHFATAPSQSTAVAEGLVHHLTHVVEHLHDGGYFGVIDVCEVGGGDGTLMSQVLALAGLQHPTVTFCARVIELRPRPSHVASTIEWIHGPVETHLPESIRGLIFAHEVLDDVPLTLAQYDESLTLRQVLVNSATGDEDLGAPISANDGEWVSRWWPHQSVGGRVEIGAARDQVWAAIASSVSTGIAIAIDYAHTHEQRSLGAFAPGTLTGFRHGYPCQPVPDGSMNITAHVALDACAVAAERACTARPVTTALSSQRDVLGLLDHSAALPKSPHEALVAIAQHSQRELARDSSSFGAFTWLIHHIGMGR